MTGIGAVTVAVFSVAGRLMPEYKFYSINPDGHIAEPPAITECSDDFTAVKNARQQLNGHDLEIWEGTRVVAYLVPERAEK